MTRAAPSAGRAPLPGAVRLGYGAGSVATGAFGTVPGLMLLPFLTDTRPSTLGGRAGRGCCVPGSCWGSASP